MNRLVAALALIAGAVAFSAFAAPHVDARRVAAERAIREALKDPYSAHIEWRRTTWLPASKAISASLLDQPGVVWACARVNAKNSFGAYEGAKLVRIGIEVAAVRVLYVDWEDTDGLCEDHGY